MAMDDASAVDKIHNGLYIRLHGNKWSFLHMQPHGCRAQKLWIVLAGYLGTTTLVFLFAITQEKI
ncbi:hypothetical protein [Pasteuria penetrans]|uniref:hypothetical protein n=1 Tax=Pasteuria penetrans TaxID=86005 RepID=UPI000F921799|nr:hypothetical protein [Pasteuria penetrans]